MSTESTTPQTPRTNALSIFAPASEVRKHARQLETELAAATQEAAQANKDLIEKQNRIDGDKVVVKMLVEERDALRAQLAEAQSQLERLNSLWNEESRNKRAVTELLHESRDQRDAFQAQLTAAQAWEKALRDALEPFAELSTHLPPDWGDGSTQYFMLSYGDIRRAAALANSAPTDKS